jgi:hypothetical protein
VAINLSTLAGKLGRTEVPFMGQSCKITYDPMVLTQERLSTAMRGGDDKFIEFFCELVKSWDVKKGNKNVPLTPNSVKSVPMLLLKAIYGHIMTLGEGDVDEGKASNDS